MFQNGHHHNNLDRWPNFGLDHIADQEGGTKNDLPHLGGASKGTAQ